MIGSALLFTSIALALFVSHRLGFYLAQARITRDISVLCSGFKSLLPHPLPPHETSRAYLATLSQHIQILKERERDFQQIFHSQHDFFTLEEPQFEPVENDQNLGASVLARLLNDVSPDILLAAVVERGDAHTGPVILSSAGEQSNRWHLQLLLAAELVFNGTAPRDARYILPEEAPHWNFRLFGVHVSRLIPLPKLTSESAFLWLGFNSPLAGVSRDRHNVIDAVIRRTVHALAFERRLEAIRRSSKQAQFRLTEVSHDIRTPGLNALYVVDGILHNNAEPLTLTQRAQLDLVSETIHDQLLLIDDFLRSLGALPSSNEIRMRHIALRATLESLYPPMASRARKRNLTLLWNIPDGIIVYFDPSHLRRIVSNLVANAIRFTDSGSVEVTVHCEASTLEILVKDTGIGMNEAAHERSKDTTRKEERHSVCDGELRSITSLTQMGLGLAITRDLAEQNGALLFYQPSPQGGSIFGVSCPYLVSNEKPRPRYSGILVIDDDAYALSYHRSMASPFTSQIFTAQSVERAREILRSERLDVIISDYYIGSECIDALVPDIARHTPILLISGVTDFPVTSLQREGRNVTTLTKPISRGELHHWLMEVATCENEDDDSPVAQETCP